MPTSTGPRSASSTLFRRRNLVLLGAAVGLVVAGYVVLASGAAEFASVLLVIGYCVLFPLALLV